MYVFVFTVIDTVAVHVRMNQSVTEKSKLSDPVNPRFGVYMNDPPVLNERIPLITEFQRVYSRISRSMSDQASPPVSIIPLFTRTFPVIVYVDQTTAGASLVHVRCTTTFPVPESAPL